MTANLYLPDGLSGKSGAVLFLCGHANESKQFGEYQRACQLLVRAGLVVLVIDPIGQAERFSYYDSASGKSIIRDGSYGHDYVGVQCALTGKGLARYFLHDAMRAIDYLCTRPEVDPERIGVTGNSGGGTQTALMMMGDPRIAAAAPGTYITSRRRYMPLGEAQCFEQVWTGFTAKGMDFADILIAMAPKPVLVLSATNDFFPIEGTRESVAEAKKFWKIYGLEENLEYFEEDIDHQYSHRMAIKAAEFFSLHLNGRRANVDDVKIIYLEPSELQCTLSGQVLADFKDARIVHDNVCDIADELRKKRLEKRNSDGSDDGTDWLRKKVFLGRRTCEPNIRCIDKLESNGLQFKYLLWWSQEDLFNYGILIRDASLEGKKLPLTIAVWDDGTKAIEEHREWITNTCAEGRCVLVLDVSGAGALAPNHAMDAYERYNYDYNSGYLLSLCLIWLDDSLPALRTYDVIRSVDIISDYNGIDGSDIKLYGNGRYGLYTRLAAMLDARVKEVIWDDAFASFESIVEAKYYDFTEIMAILMPGIMEHFDLS